MPGRIHAGGNTTGSAIRHDGSSDGLRFGFKLRVGVDRQSAHGAHAAGRLLPHVGQFVGQALGAGPAVEVVVTFWKEDVVAAGRREGVERAGFRPIVQANLRKVGLERPFHLGPDAARQRPPALWGHDFGKVGAIAGGLAATTTAAAAAAGKALNRIA